MRTEWFEMCGTAFLRPQIELVRPSVVVCLGERAYRAVMSAYRLPGQAAFRTAVEEPGVALPGRSVVFAVYHCGRRILNTHRNEHAQFQDWQRIADALNARSQPDVI